MCPGACASPFLNWRFYGIQCYQAAHCKFHLKASLFAFGFSMQQLSGKCSVNIGFIKDVLLQRQMGMITQKYTLCGTNYVVNPNEDALFTAEESKVYIFSV